MSISTNKIFGNVLMLAMLISANAYSMKGPEKAPELSEFTKDISSCLSTAYNFSQAIPESTSTNVTRYKQVLVKLTDRKDTMAFCNRDMTYCMERMNLSCESYFSLPSNHKGREVFTGFIQQFLEAYNDNKIESLTSFPHWIDCRSPIRSGGSVYCYIL